MPLRESSGTRPLNTNRKSRLISSSRSSSGHHKASLLTQFSQVSLLFFLRVSLTLIRAHLRVIRLLAGNSREKDRKHVCKFFRDTCICHAESVQRTFQEPPSEGGLSSSFGEPSSPPRSPSSRVGEHTPHDCVDFVWTLYICLRWSQ